MHRLPVTKSEGSLGKKTSQSSLLSLCVNLLPWYVQTYACLDVVSGHTKENMVTGNHQDGFRETKLCLIYMTAFCHKMPGFVDERSLVSPTLILGILNNLSCSIFAPNLIQVTAWMGKLLADKKAQTSLSQAQTAAFKASLSAHGYKVNRLGTQSCLISFTVAGQSTQ